MKNLILILAIILTAGTCEGQTFSDTLETYDLGTLDSLNRRFQIKYLEAQRNAFFDSDLSEVVEETAIKLRAIENRIEFLKGHEKK